MATAILADADIQGHVDRLIAVAESGEWAGLWAETVLPLTTFSRVGLSLNASDREVWRACQQRRVVLLTANRNHDGPDSLEAVIRGENDPTSLPVFTLADANRVLTSRDYAERVVLKLLEYLLDLDTYRGAGRLYLP
jgi:hypothetical protein